MNMKLVSAIITTHNREKLLLRAIDSVFNQTYKNIECIVVDDSSTDNTKDICSKYPIYYIYIPKAESHGGNYARNLGIKAAQGDYCAFLDDDDYWLPEKIEKQLRLIESKDCELVYCGSRQEFVLQNDIKYRNLLPDRFLCGDLHKKILQYICTTTTNIMVKKNALLEVGLFDEELRFWQEYELTIRLAQRKPFYFVNEPLSVYRIDRRDVNRLTNKYWGWRKAVEYIHEKHTALYKELNIVEQWNAQGVIWVDASIRCKLSGLYYRAVFYYIMSIPYRILKRIKK